MGQSSPDAALRYLKAAERRDREIADAIGGRIERDLRTTTTSNRSP